MRRERDIQKRISILIATIGERERRQRMLSLGYGTERGGISKSLKRERRDGRE